MKSESVEIVMVAEATEEHPRNGSADLIELKDGSLFLCQMLGYDSKLQCQAGDDAPFDLVSRTSRDGGQTWSTPRMMIARKTDETATGYCPALLRLRNGEILLTYEIFHRFVMNEEKDISGFACISRDECRTFSAPATVWSHSSRFGSSSSDTRQLSTGRIIFPICDMTGKALENDGKGLAPTDLSYAGCFYSDDNGRTWQVSDNFVYVPLRGTMEPKIEELKDGRLLMVMRTQLGSVFKSYSTDGGKSWANAQTTGLMAPESCPALLRIPQTGHLLLIWNHSPYDPKFDHYGLRSPLCVAISKDEGCTWENIKPIETDPSWEFTNPCPKATSQGTILIAYEASKYESLVTPGKLGRSRMHLKLAILDLHWLYQ